MQAYFRCGVQLKPERAGEKGKTPAEACGIQVVGENKWLTLIQNASNAEHQKKDHTQ